MKTSRRGAAFIAAHEGIVTKAYHDAAGVWTIGIGHTAAAGLPSPARGMTISRERAFAILAADLARFEKRVEKQLPGIAEHAFDGALSFDFNTGAIERAGWVPAFRAGDRLAAEANLRKWAKAGGRRVAGLVKRREHEARLIFDGDYGRAAEALDDGSFDPSIAPSVAQETDDVAVVQRALVRLDFYRGPVDGITGPATRAAVLAYQNSHPDLVADGIAGPATRASLTRDIAARTRQVEVGGLGLVGLIVAAIQAISGDVERAIVLAAGVVGLLVLVAWRYRHELTRAFSRTKGPTP
ncbi:MAG: peptidoglycan-binding protein [Bauldia sp.]